jgi:hypothetical protein
MQPSRAQPSGAAAGMLHAVARHAPCRFFPILHPGYVAFQNAGQRCTATTPSNRAVRQEDTAKAEARRLRSLSRLPPVASTGGGFAAAVAARRVAASFRSPPNRGLASTTGIRLQATLVVAPRVGWPRINLRFRDRAGPCRRLPARLGRSALPITLWRHTRQQEHRQPAPQ